MHQMIRNDIVAAVLGFGIVFDRSIPDELVQIWINTLNELSPGEIAFATKAYLLDPKLCQSFPKPGQIFSLARPTENKEEQAALIVDRIIYAARSYGKDEFNKNRAKIKIGPIGWQFIEHQGGWDNFLKGLISEEDVLILKSQARKSIMGIMDQEKNAANKEKIVTLESLGVKMKEIE
jgi:hypothetical protein